MKAWRCHAFEPSGLVLEDVPTPTPSAGEVRVTLKAAALNYPDGLMVAGRYQIKPPFPFIPGAEMAGLVSAVGPGVTGVAVGDRVVVRGTYGCLAEEVLAAQANVHPLPPDIPWASAAATPVVYSTALHALRDRGHTRADEDVLVLGASGGVGTAAIQVARVLGARVTAVTTRESTRLLCSQAGADTVLVCPDATQLRPLLQTHNVSPDVVVDPVGGDYTLPAVKSMRPGGRHLVIGFAGGSIPALPTNILLLKGVSSVGVNADFSRQDASRNAAMMRELLGWLQNGSIRPQVTHTAPLDQAATLVQSLMNHQLSGKVVLLGG